MNINETIELLQKQVEELKSELEAKKELAKSQNKSNAFLVSKITDLENENKVLQAQLVQKDKEIKDLAQDVSLELRTAALCLTKATDLLAHVFQ